MVIPITSWTFRFGKVVRKPPKGEAEAAKPSPSDWNDVGERLRDLYPTPVAGASMAELVSEGRGDR